MISLVVASVLSVGLWQDSSRDWEFRAGRWAQVAQALSKELGVPVSVHETIKNEIVVGRFIDKNYQEMSAEFARSTLTQWSNEGGRIVVRPDGRARDEESSLDRADRRALLEGAIEKSMKLNLTPAAFDETIKKAVIFNDQYKQTGNFAPQARLEIQERDPGRALALRFLEGVLDEVAQLPLDRKVRLVYASNPTAYQRSFGGREESLRSQAQLIARQWQDALSRNAVQENHTELFTFLRIRDVPTLDRVKAVIESNWPVTSVSLNFYDSNGASVFKGEAAISKSMGFFIPEDGKIPVGPYTHLTSKIQINPRDKVFGKVLARASGFRSAVISPAEKEEVTQRLAEWMTDEPLSRSATDLMFSLSRETGKDVSGHLGDFWLTQLSLMPDSMTDVAIRSLFQILAFTVNTMHVDDGHSIRLKERQANGITQNYNREAIALLAQDIVKTGRVSIDSLVSAARVSGTARSFGLSVSIAREVASNLAGVDTMRYDLRVGSDHFVPLLIYGSLPADLKQRVNSGGARFEISQLSLDSRRVLLEYLLNDPSKIDLTESLLADTAPGSGDKKAGDKLRAVLQENIDEPSYFLARPEGSHVELEMKFGSRTEYLVKKLAQPNVFQWTLEQIAVQMRIGEIARAQGRTDGAYQPIVDFAPYVSEELLMNVYIGDFWRSSQAFQMPQVTEVVFKDLAAMPEGFQAELAKELGKAREKYKSILFSDSGVKVIKP